MTRFTLSSLLKHSGQVVTIGWEDGKLFGDPELCEAVERNTIWAWLPGLVGDVHYGTAPR